MPPRDTSAGHANVCGIAQIVLFLSRTGLDFPTSTQGFSLRRRGPPLFWNAVSRWKSPRDRNPNSPLSTQANKCSLHDASARQPSPH